MASTRQCLLNQFADLSVCANQNNFHKNSILVSDLRIYLFTFNLGANPPVLASTCPVTQRASGEARNATTSATSDVVPSRPSGVRATIPFTASSPIRAVAALSIAVSTRPGATAFTVTPLGPGQRIRPALHPGQ